MNYAVLKSCGTQRKIQFQSNTGQNNKEQRLELLDLEWEIDCRELFSGRQIQDRATEIITQVGEWGPGSSENETSNSSGEGLKSSWCSLESGALCMWHDLLPDLQETFGDPGPYLCPLCHLSLLNFDILLLVTCDTTKKNNFMDRPVQHDKKYSLSRYSS